MEQLIKTYDANEKVAGNFDVEGQKYVLPPVGHMTVAAQLEITLNAAGDILQATVVPKEDKDTLIPCTPDSAARAAGIAPHPLHDNLQYVARDYDQYSEKQHKEDDHPYTKYRQQLEEWVISPYGHKKVTAVYNYISKHDIIHDLIKRQILFTEPDGSIMEKWKGDSKEKPPIFSVNGSDILKSFVRFKVDLEDGTTAALWKDNELQQSFIHFYENKISDHKILCYATGTKELPIRLHSKYIRYAGDGAKLISSNDITGFTFRGRFISGDECVSVGYGSSQKTMNALKWLIRNQGYTYYGKVFLAWGNNQEIPPLMGDTTDVVHSRLPKVNLRADSMQEFGRRFKEAIAGYKLDLEIAINNVNVIVLDAVTPGRLSICFYQEMLANDFVRRIEQWHERGKWLQYKFSGEKGVPGFYYEGIPTPKRIIEECYGSMVSENKARAAMERIFYCIINGNAIPYDMLATIVKRVITQAIKTIGNDFYDWERTLQVACSMTRNFYYQKEVYDLALDTTITDRSYLYGRLLAVADWIERSTFDKDTERLTNAVRYMNAFSQRPSKTWVTIYNKLEPYQAKLGKFGREKAALLDEIVASFTPADFASNKPLDGKFLLGYHSQRFAFQQEIKERVRLKKEREAGIKENILLVEGE